jgi:hypothetical protein
MKTSLWLPPFAALLIAACGQESDRPGTVPAPTAEPEVASSKDFGHYIVHYNAISTDQLPPEVAKNYNIVRSKNRAMLSVSILKKGPGTTGQSVAASVAAQANNLNGQLKNVNIREIKEGDAIYYIADVPVTDGEALVFTLNVTPVDETNPLYVRFTRQFYSD